MSVAELRGGHVRRRRVLLNERRGGRRHRGLGELVGDSDGGVHSKRAVERVSGCDLRYIGLGDVRAVEEDAHGTGEQIIIARVLDSALWSRRHVSSTFPGTPPSIPGDTRSEIYVGW